MSVIAELTIFPMDKGVGVSPWVARAVAIIRASGLDCQTTAMGTIMEGDYDQVMAVVGRCFMDMASDCDRVNLSLRLDYRQGPAGRMRAKVRSVEEKL